MVELRAGRYRLVLDPPRGGAIARFEWGDRPLLRPTCGDSILDVACFPLVPFSNRIAGGRFRFGSHDVVLAPNLPAADPVNPLHGFGWLAAWRVATCSDHAATLVHTHPGGAWPWPYRAEQTFALDPQGLTIGLQVTNLAAEPMPAGLGLHPYFPRDAATRYLGLHRGEWTNDAQNLPLSCTRRASPGDWWDGAPVGDRVVDTVYAERSGDLRIVWPGSGTALTITPSANLCHTVVYSPAGADFFCVEPVTHMTDAVNRDEPGAAMVALAPGATLAVSCRLAAEAMAGM